MLISSCIMVCAQDTTIIRHVHGKSLHLRIDKRTGSIIRITGFDANLSEYELTLDKFTDTNAADQIGKMFVMDYSKIFQLSMKDISKKEIFLDENGWRYSYAQLFQNIPVEGSDISFRIDKNGGFRDITSRIYPVTSCDTVPLVSLDSCRVILKKYLTFENYQISPGGDLVVLPMDESSGNKYFLAWKIIVLTTDPKNLKLTYYASARGGAILKKSGGASSL
ncbi:MAG: hypothetical protein ACHQQQ_01060 [Bacteroidota bacterium]